MPAYLIIHPAGQRRDDIHLEDDHLTLTFTGDWAIFTDANGICLALPAALEAHIQRVDEPHQPQETAPREE